MVFSGFVVEKVCFWNLMVLINLWDCNRFVNLMILFVCVLELIILYLLNISCVLDGKIFLVIWNVFII